MTRRWALVAAATGAIPVVACSLGPGEPPPPGAESAPAFTTGFSASPGPTASPTSPRRVTPSTASGASGASSTVGSSAASPADAGEDVHDGGFDAGGSPFLTALQVSPLTLQPAFSPSVHDYYVRCPVGGSRLSVSIAASPGATTSFSQPVASGLAPRQTAQLTVAENGAVVVAASDGATSTPYWIRCLPHDFPALSMSLHPAAGHAVPGYYVLGDDTCAPGESGYAMILDLQGTPVWYGRTIHGRGAKTVDLLDSNTVSYLGEHSGLTFTESNGVAEIHTLNPASVTYLPTVAMPIGLHELRRMPNGDYLLFANPIVTGVNLTGLQTFGADSDMLECVVQELDPSGALVWEWKASDHFDPVKESTFPTHDAAVTPTGERVQVVDPFHCNSIDWDASGNLLISMRQADSVSLVSRPSGTVLWKMGGTRYNRDGAPHISVTGDSLDGFYRQHHARFLPDGTISLFDDQTAKSAPARALVLSIDPGGGAARVVWQHRGTTSIQGMGSFTVLPDGSRVIGWGEGTPAFTEVDVQGHDLLDFSFPDGDKSYRALKVPSSDVNLDVLRGAVGPWSSTNGMGDAGAEVVDDASVQGDAEP